MKIVMLGSGNMSTFLAHRFVQHHHQIIQVFSRELSHARQLAEQVSAKYTNDLSLIQDKADVYILAVKDDRITYLLEELSNRNGCFVHVSGSLLMEDLLSLQPNIACLWCMYSIHKNNLPDHRNIPVFLQFQNEQTEKIAQSLAACISDDITVVSDMEKRWLHLSAVLSNNFTNHLVAIAQEILLKNGLDERLILPILEQTVSNIRSGHAKVNQTGPALRQDQLIMTKHLQLLADHPKWQQVYETISSSILDMYTSQKVKS